MERPTPEHVERVLDEVLSHPEYAKSLRTFEVDGSLAGLVERVIGWFKALGDAALTLRLQSPGIFWFIFSFLVVILILLLWHMVNSVRVTLRRTALPAERAEEGEEPVFHFRALWNRAEQLAGEGSYSEAIRHLLLALVAHMEEREVPLLAGWTNREIVEHLRVDESERGPLRELVAAVDQFWYGQQPATENDYRRSSEIVSGSVSAGRRDRNV